MIWKKDPRFHPSIVYMAVLLKLADVRWYNEKLLLQEPAHADLLLQRYWVTTARPNFGCWLWVNRTRKVDRLQSLLSHRSSLCSSGWGASAVRSDNWTHVHRYTFQYKWGVTLLDCDVEASESPGRWGSTRHLTWQSHGLIAGQLKLGNVGRLESWLATRMTRQLSTASAR